jgi:hypothetical protein
MVTRSSGRSGLRDASYATSTATVVLTQTFSHLVRDWERFETFQSLAYIPIKDCCTLILGSNGLRPISRMRTRCTSRFCGSPVILCHQRSDRCQLRSDRALIPKKISEDVTKGDGHIALLPRGKHLCIILFTNFTNRKRHDISPPK